ncbi:MAG: prepilin-type N-terminal cleavage/methylation domain-containing protein, partial [Thermoleophilia bacterium]|nr:prepilin-type N-terminal cleavage/methylation domain-containing protein [Thermoleophilia bacterium]
MDILHKLVRRRRRPNGAADASPRRIRDRRDQGFTLVEVVIAAGLLLFITAGVVPFFLTGLSQASSVRHKSVATNIARERMEEIRKMDYREIQSGTQLEGLFGTTASSRGMTFNVGYDVESSTYEDGSLKEVTVTVGWTGPPAESPASITTMIHQQYLGPRGSLLEVVTTTSDPLGSPFGVMHSTDIIRYHIAQADWGLVFDDLDNPLTSRNDSYCRLSFVDDYGQAIQIGDPANDYKLDKTYLDWSTDGDGDLLGVWYEAPVSGLPFWQDEDGAADAFGNRDGYYDGYWELNACAYNYYDQPGNTWRLRVRVE